MKTKTRTLTTNVLLSAGVLLFSALVGFGLPETFDGQRVRITLGVAAVISVLICEFRLFRETRLDALAVSERKVDVRIDIDELAEPEPAVPDEEKTEEQKLIDGYLRIADFAFKRKNVIEAYYWALKAMLHGSQAGRRLMNRYRSVWTSLGCPTHYESSDEFTTKCAYLAIFVLRLTSRVDPNKALRDLKGLAATGFEEAQAFLERIGCR